MTKKALTPADKQTAIYNLKKKLTEYGCSAPLAAEIAKSGIVNLEAAVTHYKKLKEYGFDSYNIKDMVTHQNGPHNLIAAMKHRDALIQKNFNFQHITSMVSGNNIREDEASAKLETVLKYYDELKKYTFSEAQISSIIHSIQDTTIFKETILTPLSALRHSFTTNQIERMFSSIFYDLSVITTHLHIFNLLGANSEDITRFFSENNWSNKLAAIKNNLDALKANKITLKEIISCKNDALTELLNSRTAISSYTQNTVKAESSSSKRPNLEDECNDNPLLKKPKTGSLVIYSAVGSNKKKKEMTVEEATEILIRASTPLKITY
jgi:hypothetical protein